jgi:hypothetical protein
MISRKRRPHLGGGGLFCWQYVPLVGLGVPFSGANAPPDVLGGLFCWRYAPPDGLGVSFGGANTPPDVLGGMFCWQNASPNIKLLVFGW